jgi:hypothetical protein
MFTMNGGEISGNNAKDDTVDAAGDPIPGGGNGGGVYIAATGSFRMTGGTIKNNTATGKGPGVYVGGTFTIAHNTAKKLEIADTIFLPNTKYISVESTLENITGKLTVEMENPASGQTVAQIAGAYAEFSTDDLAKFQYVNGAHTFAITRDGTRIVIV